MNDGGTYHPLRSKNPATQSSGASVRIMLPCTYMGEGAGDVTAEEQLGEAGSYHELQRPYAALPHKDINITVQEQTDMPSVLCRLESTLTS